MRRTVDGRLRLIRGTSLDDTTVLATVTTSAMQQEEEEQEEDVGRLSSDESELGDPDKVWLHDDSMESTGCHKLPGWERKSAFFKKNGYYYSTIYQLTK